MTRTKWVKVKSKIHSPFGKLKLFHQEVETIKTVSLIRFIQIKSSDLQLTHSLQFSGRHKLQVTK